MRWEHRGYVIELWLVDIHYPNYPHKKGEGAKAVWKVAINGEENSGTRTGDREKVLGDLKEFVDWVIDDPGMTELFW